LHRATLGVLLASCAHAPPPRTGDLHVHVAQPGARIFIDSEPVARTSPDALDAKLSVGAHRVMIVADGFYRAYYDLLVSDSGVAPLEVTLRPVPPGEAGD
jgi:hypothetical protein